MSVRRPPTAHRHPHSNARQFDLFCDVEGWLYVAAVIDLFSRRVVD
jgi:hypothetical protein